MRCFALASLFVVSGCASMAQPETPAVIVDPTAESRAELRKAITDALSRTDVTLADDALTQSSFLLIERRPARDPTGQRLSGRDLDKPETFQLMKDGERCTLVHERTSQRFSLEQAQCRSEGAARQR